MEFARPNRPPTAYKDAAPTSQVARLGSAAVQKYEKSGCGAISGRQGEKPGRRAGFCARQTLFFLSQLKGIHCLELM